MIIYFHLRQRHHCSGAAIISLSVKSLAHKVFCLQRLRVDLKINRISQAREAVEQMCVCVCVQGPGFLYPVLNRWCKSMRPWTFGHLEALCFQGKWGVLGGVENVSGEGSLREPWLHHACIWEQV